LTLRFFLSCCISGNAIIKK